MTALEEVKRARKRRDRAEQRRDRAEQELAEAIKQARASETLQAVADAAGVTRQRVWQIERGI